MRELHWHSLAAEWAYVLEGRCRATVITPNGQSEIADFGPGDTWYFPRGHGHALQAWTRRVPFPAGLRQRPLLGIRHLQHHRLDRQHAAATS